MFRDFRAFELPDGEIRSLYLHWSAGPYDQTSSAYHFVVGYERGQLFARQTHDVRENMRSLSEDLPYAAHTRGRNSYAIGVSALSMLDATPQNFGPAPLTDELVDALCAMCAFLARRYHIIIDAEHVMTHAEAAIIDSYFGLLPEERWDLARLRPVPVPITASEAKASGEALRARIRSYL
ncbi:MAG: peptidoglycan recognition protein family protein [Candidatus Eremiobacter antarcticus]|nr:N-acetylmuramoyl-L-alanine amidase [Candidatus Eremiobacteraeota bacterium]MBC5808573.1 N-acetylmuramoyl-L-alanine amidase [Candidatus Eremiobacteraeota bacterium]